MLTVTAENEDFLAKSLVIGVTVDDIMAEFNVFDWMELRDIAERIIEDFKKRLNFKTEETIKEKAFLHKFQQAVTQLSTITDEVHSSYNIPGSEGVRNDHINQYYYLKYWADKKHIAVDYNETDYEKRKLFNLYTILFDIFADKLNHFNAYNRQKKQS